MLQGNTSSDEYENDDDDNDNITLPSNQSRVKPKPIREYRKFNCSYPECRFQCTNHRNFAIHIESSHECYHCGKYYLDVASHNCPLNGQYRHQQHGQGVDQTIFQLQLPSSHQGVIQIYEHEPKIKYVTLNEMFEDLHSAIVRLLTETLEENTTIKVQFKVSVDLEDIRKKTILPDKWLSTAYFPITHPNFITNYINFFLAYLNGTLAIWNQNESGYTLKSINLFQIRIAKYDPVNGGAYIKLPKELARKRGLLNINSSSYYCFHFCIAAAFYSGKAITLFKNRKKIKTGKKLSVTQRNEALCNSETYVPFLKNFDFQGLRKPVPVEDLSIFESNNDISINCYGLCGKKVKIIRQTTMEKERHVDLLLLTGEEGSHYILVKDISSFLGKKGKHRHMRCKYCLRKFRQKHALNNHLSICIAKSNQTMKFPKEDFYTFKNMHETIRFPFVLYYDFETFSQTMNNKVGRNTINVGKLTPAQYSLVLIGPGGFECAKIYEGNDVINDFLKSADAIADQIRSYLKITNNRIPLTLEQEAEYRTAKNCALCQGEFTKKNIKVRHHCHVSGQQLSIICSCCNKRARTQYVIPILSHGGTNFDHHLIIKGMNKSLVKDLQIIPQSGQKFMGFILNKKLKFLDSCKFMPGKLSAHAKCLLKDGENGFEILFQYFEKIKPGESFYKIEGYTRDEIRMLLGKQAFPYEAMTGPEIFKMTELPKIEAFRNNMKLKDLKPESYRHAQKVWSTFQCKTFKDYSRLYCMVDTLILACIMETQRKAAFEAYGLDMLHKWSAPGFSHSAGMFSSKAKIQYIKDEEMVKMIRGGIRGGPVFCNTRLFTANNERVGNYNPELPRTHIFYADLKSLYPYCLLNSVPIDSFEWLNSTELEQLDVANLPEDEGIGYIFECDLIYDKDLHDNHNDLPLAPHKMNVTLEDISGTQHDILKAHLGKSTLKEMSVEKLVLTLEDKKSYVTYYKTLKFYLKHGLKINGKVKRGIKFREAPIFREYIGNNLARREAEVLEVMRLVIKLASNSFYGKMLQSSSAFKDVLLCRSKAHALHLVSKAEFDDFYEIDKDLSIFIMNRKGAKEDSLFFIAFVVLELAKMRLMEAHYEGIKTVFQDRCRIAYSDTDSAIYLISDPANTYISDLKKLSFIFDYSSMKGHELFDKSNVGRAGVFKMEAMDIYQFCGLSAKLYSYIMSGDEVCEDKKRMGEKKAKGVSKAVIKHAISHADYVRTVLDMIKTMNIEMRLIRSKDHQMHNQTVRKVALSALDMKRYLLPNGIDTYALGHYKIKELEREQHP